MTKNVCYNPGECGLTTLDTMDEPGLSYEFNTMKLWQDLKTDRVFYAHSSGCSCPTPFEEYYFESADDNDLNEVTQQNFSGFERTVDSFPVTMEERQAFVTAAKEALARREARNGPPLQSSAQGW